MPNEKQQKLKFIDCYLENAARKLLSSFIILMIICNVTILDLSNIDKHDLVCSLKNVANITLLMCGLLIS